MVISHRHRCIYVKVPKCASASVLDWFLTHGGGWHSFRPWWYGGLLSERIQEVTRALNLYPDYTTFSFMRNPYGRFVSIYLYLRRLAQAQAGDAGAHCADYGTFREFAELCREVLDDFGPLWGRAARAFFRAHGDREYGPGRIRLKHFGFVTGHARRQTDFLPDCNRECLFGVARVDDAPLSFVGSVEDMAADWRRLGGLLGLPAVALPGCNAAEPGTGRGRREGYAAYYDGATRRLVEDIYAADLDFTGCGFDDGRVSIAVAGRRASCAAAHLPRGAGSRLARAWHRVRSFEVGVEDRSLRNDALRRILRPLGRVRGLPR